ncbi:hypothetical protein [Acidipila sp. EB88]|uniref:hypothetical protein n=1 Tax=Acidipila sp. EB88 TaxID=2305226 RepID=UPI000F5D9803|nr:hypothetical protein [Acidipila sp. EB88]RRA48992.1 hypothetical protein D1Y84_12620 [Acidipila sp. EB88]
MPAMNPFSDNIHHTLPIGEHLADLTGFSEGHNLEICDSSIRAYERKMMGPNADVPYEDSDMQDAYILFARLRTAQIRDDKERNAPYRRG